MLVAEGGGVQARVEHPPRAGLAAGDFGGEADDGAGGVAEHGAGEAALVEPVGEQIENGFVGVDAAAAGDRNEPLGQLEHGFLVFLGRGLHLVQRGVVSGVHRSHLLPRGDV